MSAASAETSKKKNVKPKTNEEILVGFQKLRSEQRFLTNKLNEMEIELQEHKIVLDTLKDLDGNRKCFRMVGGVLCERTVKDVVPILTANKEQISKVIDTLNQQVITKGTELNEYKEDHNVRIKGIDEVCQVPPDSDSKSSSGGVLVS